MDLRFRTWKAEDKDAKSMNRTLSDNAELGTESDGK